MKKRSYSIRVMKISEETIEALSQTITGDNEKSFYRSGSDLVDFFNELGFNDQYDSNFPTRVNYVEDKIETLNGSEELVEVFELLLEPRNYIEKDFERSNLAEYLNQYLKFDGYKLVKQKEYFKVKDLSDSLIEVESDKQIKGASTDLIEEQLDKCENKIINGDYDGAITNARSLLETVFKDIKEGVSGERPDSNDLNELYKEVYNSINLDPSRDDITNSLKEVLSGLVSVVNGIASLRNRMSDAHSRKYKPEKHHAILVVNCANTIVNFTFDTYKYQKERGDL